VWSVECVTSDEVGDWQAAIVPTSPEISQVETATDQSTWTQLIQADCESNHVKEVADLMTD